MTDLIITHCKHGLDLRLYPRCFLCKPLECPEHKPPRPYYPTVTVSTIGHTVRCSCPPDRGDNYAGTCPIHDVTMTYTATLP